MKLITMRFGVSRVSYSEVIYRIKSIGDSGESCGILMSNFLGLVVVLSKFSSIDWSVN